MMAVYDKFMTARARYFYFRGFRF